MLWPEEVCLKVAYLLYSWHRDERSANYCSHANDARLDMLSVCGIKPPQVPIRSDEKRRN